MAKSDIGLGQSVKPEDMQWQTWPAATASNTFIRRSERPDATNQIVGSIARSPFIAGEPIREPKLVKANGSGFMAAILPTGMRAVSTEISPETGAGGFILPNDRVDVILSKRDKNPDRAGSPDIVNSEIILSNVRVLAIDQAPKEKDGQNAVVGKTVTLELKPEQAETLARAHQTGTLSLALRSIADVNMVDNRDRRSGPAGAATASTWFATAFPARRRYRSDQKDADDMKCRGNQPPMRAFVVRALSFSAVAALTLNPALSPVVAADYRAAAPAAPVAADGQMNARFLALGIGKSIVIDLPRDIKDVLVADPKIANAVVRSAQRAYIIGAAVGQTNIVFFDSAGQQIAAYDIAVKRDLNGVRAALKQMLPNADIQIEGVGDGVMLTGSVATPIEAQQAGDLAARLAGGADKVVNSIAVRGRDQVMLKVTVAEVARSIIKQMGIDLSASLNYGTSVVTFNNANPFTANGQPLVGGNALTTSFGSTPSVKATLRAMESAGVVRTLAEPNLTAISGEVRDLHRRRRISDSDRRDLPDHGGGLGRTVRPVDRLQEIRHLAQLHAGRAHRRPDQPAGDDGSIGSLQRQFDQHRADIIGSLDQDPPRRNDAGNSLRRLDGDGRPDPATDQAGDQRTARPVDRCRCWARCSAAATSSTTRPS